MFYVIINSKKQVTIVLQIDNIATIFTTKSEEPHSSTNASTAYLAKLKHIIATCDGFNINVDIQENKNAGIGPKASIKQAYSAPELGFIVPSSAYDRAPNNKEIIFESYIDILHFK